MCSGPPATLDYKKRSNSRLAEPLFGKATQRSQSEPCLGGWRCKGPSEAVDRRRLGGSTSRKTWRPSKRSRAKAKDGNGSYSNLSRMDGIGCLLRKMWTCGTGGSTRQRKPLIMPGDVRTTANPTCGASARVVDLYGSNCVRFALFCFFAVVLICFPSAI